ncbi:MAG: hypothetical protein ACXABO_08255 [Promethearchaeota archaeon]|jgi:hypothetical protein
MRDEIIREELKQLRSQARSQVIVLISSLILIFLWFTNISWATKQATFSSKATQAAGEALGMGTSHTISITIVLSVIITIFYVILLKRLISSKSEDPKMS